jgi:hypothetical protein
MVIANNDDESRLQLSKIVHRIIRSKLYNNWQFIQLKKILIFIEKFLLTN